ncbi:MAG: cupin domain-containing protein [Marinobacter sp.]|uniref:cupin domain-containing protein n=1 Tax=Marinobacter sp. TaxID=50741 RepID=UPI00396DD6DE
MDDVGSQLRAVRQAAGLSQRELAKRAGVTNSMISMIEKNKVSPSVGSLKKVLSGVPMSLLDFFMTEEPGHPSAPVVYRKDEMQPIDAEAGILWTPVGSNFPNRKMAFMEERYPPGSDTGRELFQHEGEEAGLIISGKLELTIDDEAYILEPGDGYYFETTRPHRFRNPFDETCLLVSSLTPPKL